MSKPEFSDEFDFENRILDTSEIPEDNIEGRIIGHNELAAKACPSFDVQEWLKEIGINQ